MNKNWIVKATENKGALHKALKIPMEEKISKKKLDKAITSKSTTIRKQANLAKTLRNFRPRGM